MLGRETAIQEAYWGDDDWLYVKQRPGAGARCRGARHARRGKLLGRTALHFSARRPCPSISSGCARPKPSASSRSTDRTGKLRLFGRESIGSWFEQALVARRQTHFSYDAETVVAFSPTDEREHGRPHRLLQPLQFPSICAVTAHSDGKRELLIMSSIASYPDGKLTFPADPVPMPDRRARSAAQGRGSTIRTLQFYLATEGPGLASRSGRCSMPRSSRTNAAAMPSMAASPAPLWAWRLT